MHGAGGSKAKTVAASRERFVTLDAMRGVAALAVILFHFGYSQHGPYPRHGTLAVDAFFVLSGFVLAYKYDAALISGRLSASAFIWKRIKRLGLVYFVGLVLGLFVQVFVVGLPTHPGSLLVADGLNAFGLPAIFCVQPIVHLFPVNAPFWSLFLELWVANVLYSRKWLQGRALASSIMLSALVLVSYAVSGVSLSLGFTEQTLPLGVARVVFSFFTGVWVAQRFAISQRRYPIHAGLVLGGPLVLLACPLKGHLGEAWDLGAILIGFPCLTFLGTHALHMPRRIGELLGEASYTAYAIHFPLLLALIALMQSQLRRHRSATELVFVVLICALSVLIAKIETRVRRLVWPSSS